MDANLNVNTGIDYQSIVILGLVIMIAGTGIVLISRIAKG